MNREEFVAEIRAIAKNDDLDVEIIAEYADVSIPTVRRWISGRNVPHEYMRSGVIETIKRAIVQDTE